METPNMQDRDTQLVIYVTGLLTTLYEEGYVTGGYRLSQQGTDLYDGLRLRGFPPLTCDEMAEVFAGIVVAHQREESGLPFPDARPAILDILEATGAIGPDGTVLTTANDFENSPKFKAFSEMVDLLIKIQQQQQALVVDQSPRTQFGEAAVN